MRAILKNQAGRASGSPFHRSPRFPVSLSLHILHSPFNIILIDAFTCNIETCNIENATSTSLQPLRSRERAASEGLTRIQDKLLDTITYLKSIKCYSS